MSPLLDQLLASATLAPATVTVSEAKISQDLSQIRISDDTAEVAASFVVAESAAIVLFTNDTIARKLMLQPRLIAHVSENNLVETFADALGHFDGDGRLLSICGPSKTADIEKRLVTGVHGPAEVLIIVHRRNSPA